MFKRATWLTIGFGLGVGSTIAAAREVRKRVDRYQPDAMVNRMTDSLAALRDRLELAVDDGRTAARAREAELRDAAPRRDPRA